MTQDDINKAEWENPENWSDGPGWLYFSKKDSRVWIPKRTSPGKTINLAREGGAKVLVNIIVGMILFYGATVIAMCGLFAWIQAQG